MKGIILAGGSGTRLAPLTNVISKQLLPVYDKPMICYPLSTLMCAGIKDILIISTAEDLPHIKKFLNSGIELGIKIEYEMQEKPKGIAEAFIIGEKFIGDDDVCLILGDNIFYGSEINREHLQENFEKINQKEVGAYIFAYHVSDPERYGVIEFDEDQETPISIEEKPLKPKSSWAVTGLYIYNNQVIKIAKSLKPSKRGEIEITDINKKYLVNKKLGVIKLKRGFAWLDAGTPDSLLDSAQFIQTIEKRQGLKISCLEEIAYRNQYISFEELKQLAVKYKKGSAYRQYLDTVIKHVLIV
jgi:glucose-1-phosphate thymidylyltransferase